MKRKKYEQELYGLQIELCKLQRHIAKNDLRLCVIFEGRDTAGKGGSIKRLTQYLPPREVRAVALPKPNERERDSWYFQRYVPHLPAKGEIILFDRSWYNRAGVEPVMGFCSDEQHRQFLLAVPHMEEMLANDGITLVKFWLDINKREQADRLNARKNDPLKTWKLSPMEAEAQKRWDAYSEARNTMLAQTDHKHGHWTVIEATDKRRARLTIIRHVLAQFDYGDRDGKLTRPDSETARTFRPEMLGDGSLHA